MDQSAPARAGERPYEHHPTMKGMGAPLEHEHRFKNIPIAAAVALTELVDYAEGRVVSRTLAREPAVGVTLFAFDAGEGLSTHSSPGDALLTVLDGDVEVTIDDAVHSVVTGESIVMPANVPHAVHADERCKLLLIVVKAPGGS
jgi:quercetin dioxygenase-like cupin family protein